MDVYCATCGEPWDCDYLRHELAGETTENLIADGWTFGAIRLAVLRCPACPKSGADLPDAEDRRRQVRALAELLHGDEDGLAAELSDLHLKQEK